MVMKEPASQQAEAEETLQLQQTKTEDRQTEAEERTFSIIINISRHRCSVRGAAEAKADSTRRSSSSSSLLFLLLLIDFSLL